MLGKLSRSSAILHPKLRGGKGVAPRDDRIAGWVRHGACEVPENLAGIRLDAFLARQFPYRSRTQWVRLLRMGRVSLNGSGARPGQTLRGGDQIRYLPDPRPEPRVSRSYRILFEDASLLAVRKPAHLPVHPSGRYYRNTLLMMLLEERKEHLDTATLRIVHRLDRETSGVILFGKGREAAAALAAQFEYRHVRKTYLAIVHGNPARDHFLIDAPIGRDLTSVVRKAMTVTPEGQPARTSVKVLRRGADHALVLARPHTGRLHQIRVHLRHAGHPVLGDKVYGLDPGLFLRFVGSRLTTDDRRRLLWRRQALHAWKLRFAHPRDGRVLEVRAPVGGRWLRQAEHLGLGAS
jgi:23S rRNA pseudouridine1911/1915/1917 synthase